MKNHLVLYWFIEFFQSSPGNELGALLIAIFIGCYSAGLLFLACELCQRTSDLFTELSDEALQFNWYLFPNGINRNLLILLPAIHKPISIEVFGHIACDRQSFKKVCYKYICGFFKISCTDFINVEQNRLYRFDWIVPSMFNEYLFVIESSSFFIR